MSLGRLRRNAQSGVGRLLLVLPIDKTVCLVRYQWALYVLDIVREQLSFDTD
jgi:hypothetical protein